MSVLMSRTRHHKSATNASSRSSPAAPERDMSCITCLNLKRPLFQSQTLVLAEQAECQHGRAQSGSGMDCCASRLVKAGAREVLPVESEMVPRGGIEPPTLRFSVACSTN